MLPSVELLPIRAYKITCEDGERHLIYNASAIGNPADHVADKWYARPYSAPHALGADIGEPFDSAQDAERSVRGAHNSLREASRLA